jgi:hypothetical protein
MPCTPGGWTPVPWSCASCCLRASYPIHTPPPPPVPPLPCPWASPYPSPTSFLPANKEAENQLFFWLARKSDKPVPKDLVVFLNGGPGCSSLDGMFLEVGPFQALGQGKLVERPHSWVEHATLLFIEQPVGTGFSFTSNPAASPRNLEEVAAHLLTFLENFYAVFPEHHGANLYLAGESFAGTGGAVRRSLAVRYARVSHATRPPPPTPPRPTPRHVYPLYSAGDPRPQRHQQVGRHPAEGADHW